jgi:hypothetical protein
MQQLSLLEGNQAQTRIWNAGQRRWQQKAGLMMKPALKQTAFICSKFPHHAALAKAVMLLTAV